VVILADELLNNLAEFNICPALFIPPAWLIALVLLRNRTAGVSHTARKAGATAKFAGSGGAIVGTYKDENTYQELTRTLNAIGVAVVKPKIVT